MIARLARIGGCLALTALALAGCGSGATPTDHGVHDATANGVPLNSTRSQVQARLGPPLRVHADDLGTGPLTCLDYRALDKAGTTWEFCFDRRGHLTAKGQD